MFRPCGRTRLYSFAGFAAKKRRLAPLFVAAVSRAQYLPRRRDVPARELRSGDRSYVSEATSTENCRCTPPKRRWSHLGNELDSLP